MPDAPEPYRSTSFFITRPLNWIHDILIRLGFKKAPFSTRAQITSLLVDTDPLGDDITAQERLLLKNILLLKTIRVDDVMIPRADIFGLDLTTPLEAALKGYQREGHSRVLLYRDTLDDPIGLVHVKDIMGFMISQSINNEDENTSSHTLSHRLAGINFSTPIGALKLARPLLYVPPSMPAHDLLIQMQASRKHLAVVVDEYGGTDGLISIEDLLEIVVGDIEDEHDTEEKPQMRAINQHSLIADARVELIDLAERLQNGFQIDNIEQMDTLGGLIFSLLGRVPAKGETIAYSGYELEILDVDARRIKKVKVSKATLQPTSLQHHIPPRSTSNEVKNTDKKESSVKEIAPLQNKKEPSSKTQTNNSDLERSA